MSLTARDVASEAQLIIKAAVIGDNFAILVYTATAALLVDRNDVFVVY